MSLADRYTARQNADGTWTVRVTSALTPAEQARVGTIIMTGSSHDASTFTQIGTQTNYHRP